METPEVQANELMQQSMQVGQNILAFLDAVKLSGRTAQERQTLQVYSATCEIAEKLGTGELVIVHSSALQQGGEAPEGDSPEDSTEDGGEE